MQQLLILGFHCKIYRKSPLIRIFINDDFIDEFHLPATNYDEVKQKNMWEQITFTPEEQILEFKKIHKNISTNKALKGEIENINETSKITISNPFLKFINFDDIDSKKLIVRLEVINNDSNYSNGFMTKSTLVMLNQFFVVSKNLIERINTLENDYRYSYNNLKYEEFEKFLLTKERTPMFKSILDIDNLNAFYEESEKRLEICGESNNLSNSVSEYWLGGNTTIIVKLTKKHRIWVEANYKNKGPWRLGDVGSIKYLLNKYKQYENY